MWLANSPGKMLVAGAVAVTLGDDARLPHRFSTPLARHSWLALCERCPLSASHTGVVGPCGAYRTRNCPLEHKEPLLSYGSKEVKLFDNRRNRSSRDPLSRQLFDAV